MGQNLVRPRDVRSLIEINYYYQNLQVNPCFPRNPKSAIFTLQTSVENDSQQSKSDRFTMDSTTVFVWQIPLVQSPEHQDSLRKLLSDDEVQRANRFVFPIHRDRFVVARGALRKILGRALSIDPQDIRFDYNRHGKPAVANSLGSLPISFNLSHSADLALCAVTLDRILGIGIDVEELREVSDADRMATRYFDPHENASYQSLPHEERREGFLVRWTMKEAYIKARGEGLSIPLDQFAIVTEPDAAGFHHVRSADRQQESRWGVKRLSPPAGYVAAMVAEGFDWSVVYRNWPEDLR